jgi:hypothetical protein
MKNNMETTKIVRNKKNGQPPRRKRRLRMRHNERPPVLFVSENVNT